MLKMFRGFGGATNISDVTADAKMDVYADAIMEYPAWALDAAIKRWARGSCPSDVEESPHFSFPPSPATLRKLVLIEIDLGRRYKTMLSNLVEATSLEDALNPDAKPPTGTAVAPTLRRMP